ncbi:hypothetical protein AXF42_Ash001820 [Apostasia shenzhenica]|uniref:Protein SWEETIE n=1 Tax=Apostasia shenzhenica TaxID=1088818 RepID=A0A2I0ABC0_9ASPA|nr:hypothetical protein AXF42_Ash001820 [Apostasia shenzhenica]
MAKRQNESVALSNFGVLVAQLESIAASAHQQPPDPLLCFDLLSALVVAIDEESQESIVKWQRKCEDALCSLLVMGARRPVRRLASSAMVKVISKGDGISIYSRASSLQGWLADCKRSDPLPSAGLAQCLGELYRKFGRRITSGLVETANIAGKLMKFNEDFVRQDALQMLENALEGSGPLGASVAYSESFRIIMRFGLVDKSFVVRLAAARCLKTFASIGGPGIGETELENSMLLCLKALEDPVSSVRDALSEALGALLFLAMNPGAQVNRSGKDIAVPTKLGGSLQKYLIAPFTRASGGRAKDMRIGLTLSWVFFLQVNSFKYRLQDNELQNYAFEAIGMLQGNASTDAHALACVIYILRVGIIDQMTEGTQRSFLVHLAKKLEFVGYNPSAVVATLRILLYLLSTLGEVPVEFKEIIDNTVVAALSHSSLHVRVEAALTMRALAEVDPASVGGLISYGVTTLYALRESVANGRGSQLNNELFSLNGQATVLAALISISPKLPLGYPTRLPKSILEVSKKLLTEFSRDPTAATVEMESGWLLLASLIGSMPKEELEDQVFDVLLLWADPFVGGSDSRTRKARDLTSDLWVLSTAIEALNTFIRSFISSTCNGGIFLQPVLAYLCGALSHISSLAAKPLPSLRPAIDLFTIRTLMAYQSISDPRAYKSEHSQILQICTTPFREPSICEESSCLKFLLDKRDACLGPWIPGRDSFEDELRSFDGGKDGLVPCVWEEDISSFPQPDSISKLLVNQMLLCLGNVVASQDDGEKALLLTQIDHCLTAGKKQAWHLANITNSCVALLAALKAMLGARLQSCGIEILNAIQSTFQGILTEGDISSAQRRACAEGLGLLARLGSDIFTARMTKNLLGELVSGADPNYIASVALSLGCIHRSVGGIALSSLVPATVSSVSSLAKSSSASFQLWSLHALLLTIEAAGLSFVSQVQSTLILVMEILLGDENGLVEIRQEIARIVNAIVAVLGPELAPGSTFFSRCKCVITEISSCQEISALFEAARFTQQLVIFAPQAVSVHTHVQNLLPTLSSRQKSLRYLAVSTLSHLIEKDPSMSNEKIEEDLFFMLDEETDSEIANLVRATIFRLLYASCPTCPSRWLSILRKMILSTLTRNHSENIEQMETEPTIITASEGDVRPYYGEDDEDMIASSVGEPMQGLDLIYKREKHLRYRTRLFAAECLGHLPKAVGANLAHFDLSLARSHNSMGCQSIDWLVLHLQEVISISYQISISQFVGMQSIGVELLSTIMDKFGKTEDPELPGHLLLEQYQAQLVSAVRSAINTSSGPVLLEAGLQLATKVLTSSILSGDRVAVSRMFSLISRPLNEMKDLHYPSFAEWVECKIKVRLLAAHASIKSFVYQFFRKEDNVPDEYLQLASLLSSSSVILGQYWILILRDYAFMRFGLNFKPSFKPFLEGIQSPLISSKVQACMDETWPLILEAISLDAIPVRFEDDQATNIADLPNSSFLSGNSMVRLELRDYYFLWGLAWLIVFQGQQPLLATQTRKLFSYAQNNSVGDSAVQETYKVSSEIALLVFQSLSLERFFSREFLTLDLCKELFQILIYADPSTDSWNSIVVGLLSQIVLFCPDVYYETEDFTTAAIELSFKCLAATFHGGDLFSQDEVILKGLFSQILNTAQCIVKRIKNQKTQYNMIAALISTTCGWFRRALTEFCLAKLLVFLPYLFTFLKTCIKDDVVHDIDYHTLLETVLMPWVSMLASLSDGCIKRISISDSKGDDISKLYGKMLYLCLEETVALAKIVYEAKIFKKNEERSHLMLYPIFKHCNNCIKNTLHVSHTKVQAIGLNVLKSIAQRELAETLDSRSHFFFLFFCAELIGDIYLLIQHGLKELLNKEAISVIEECLRLLFLFYTLTQRIEQTQAALMFLLEALVMMSSISCETHSQGLHVVNSIVKRMVAHLIKVPSSAAQLKDVMLSMPVLRRQQLQDMIRASVVHNQEIPTKMNEQSESKAIAVNQQHDLAVIVPPITVHEEACANAGNAPDDEDDDGWDVFQSSSNPESDVPVARREIETTTDASTFQHPEATFPEEPSELQKTQITTFEEMKMPYSGILPDTSDSKSSEARGITEHARDGHESNTDSRETHGMRSRDTSERNENLAIENVPKDGLHEQLQVRDEHATGRNGDDEDDDDITNDAQPVPPGGNGEPEHNGNDNSLTHSDESLSSSKIAEEQTYDEKPQVNT